VAKFMSSSDVYAKVKAVLGDAGRVLMVTGHKDVILALSAVDREALKQRIRDCFEYWKPTVAVQGMAEGADRLFAEVAIEYGCWLVCALPYAGQRRDDTYHAIKAYERVLPHMYRDIHQPKDKKEAVAQLFGRNEWMVTLTKTYNGKCLAISDGRSTGGTAHCKRDALKKGVEVWTISPVAKENVAQQELAL